MYSNSVIPVYLYDSETKKYHSVGSSVLLSYRNRKFFVTAAHVMETVRAKKTFIFFEDVLYNIEGVTAYLSDSSLFGDRDNDPIDLAVMPILDHLLSIRFPERFITLDQCLAGSLINSPLFQIIGFPQAKNTKAINRTVRIPGEFRSYGLRYTVTDASSKAFPHKNFSNLSHIAISLSKTGKTQGINTHMNIPDLHGVSGGLLQKVGNYNSLTDGFDIAYPAGVVLEKKLDNSVLFSIRLEFVFEWLESHWDIF